MDAANMEQKESHLDPTLVPTCPSEHLNQVPYSEPGEPGRLVYAGYWNHNHQQIYPARQVSIETTVSISHMDNDMESVSDVDLRNDSYSNDVYDSGNDADVSCITDSDSDITHSDTDIDNPMNNSSDGEVEMVHVFQRGHTVVVGPLDLAHRYQLYNWSHDDDDESDDSHDDDDLFADDDDNNEKDTSSTGFVDQNVIVERIYDTDWCELLNGAARRSGDYDVFVN